MRPVLLFSTLAAFLLSGAAAFGQGAPVFNRIAAFSVASNLPAGAVTGVDEAELRRIFFRRHLLASEEFLYSRKPSQTGPSLLLRPGGAFA